MGRSIMKTWRVIKRVIREQYPAHRERFSCGTYWRSRTEIFDNTLHYRTLAGHICVLQLDKVGNKDQQRRKNEEAAKRKYDNSHHEIYLLTLEKSHEKQAKDNENQWLNHSSPRKRPKP